MSIEIVDNFLKKDDFQEIKNSLESKDIPWFFNRVISRDSDSKEENKELAERNSRQRLQTGLPAERQGRPQKNLGSSPDCARVFEKPAQQERGRPY